MLNRSSPLKTNFMPYKRRTHRKTTIQDSSKICSFFFYSRRPILCIGKICISDICYKHRIQYNFYSVKWSKVVVKDKSKPWVRILIDAIDFYIVLLCPWIFFQILWLWLRVRHERFEFFSWFLDFHYCQGEFGI